MSVLPGHDSCFSMTVVTHFEFLLVTQVTTEQSGWLSITLTTVCPCEIIGILDFPPARLSMLR